MSDQKLIAIIGVPHSGSTIFWRAFRKNTDFMCFDEPLTANIGVHFPQTNKKKTFEEYIKIFGDRPEDFWKIYRPIHPVEEAGTRLDDSTISYLKALCDLSRVTVVDETHLCMMVPEIAKIHENVWCIHLVRRASAFVTSHLLPSVKVKISDPRTLARHLRRVRNRSVFFDRHDFLPGMARDQVIGHHPDSRFALLLRDAGYDHRRIMHAPVAVRLLAYWHYCYHAAEADGARTFGDRFRTVRYESFATEPESVMADLYTWVDEKPPKDVAYRDVYSPKPSFRTDDKRWAEYAKIAGFTEAEIDELL